MVDYDLVVIGGDRVGVWAAIAARRLHARVALVDQGHTIGRAGDSADLSIAGLAELARSSDRCASVARLGITALPSGTSPAVTTPSAVDWTIALHWLQDVSNQLQVQQSPTLLATLGIDVIHGLGQFERKPLRFQVDRRSLRSRTYLVVQPQCPMLPAIDGVLTTPCLTPDTIWEWVAIGNNHEKTLVILGSDPTAIVLAQALNRLGIQVTLVIPDDRCLPHVDLELASWLQAILEAEGVTIFTGLQTMSIQHDGAQTCLQLDDRAITADALLITPTYQPAVEALNLAAAGVRWSQRGIRHNSYLKTTNTRIYACSNDRTLSVGIHEASVAIRNALVLPIHKPSYRCVPQVVATDPPFAWVGLTEQQAIAQHGDRCIILRQSFSTLPTAQIQGETTGFCKLIVHRNGHLLGAQIVGAPASELMGTIALAMQQRCSITTLAHLPHPSPGFSSILHQVAEQWQHQRYGYQASWLENWHHLRRSWF